MDRREMVPSGLFPYDIRIKRELAHRRLVVSMTRRLLRVLSLHGLDAALLIGLMLLLTSAAPFAHLRSFAPAVVAIFLLSLNALSAYNPGDARRDGKRLLLGVVLAVLMLSSFVVFEPRIPVEPHFLLLLSGGAFFALALGRKLVDAIVRQAYVHGIGLRRALIIGNLDEVGSALEQLRDHRNIDQYVVGHLTVADEPDPTALGTLERFPEILDELDVQEVIVATTLSREMMRTMTECCFERGTLPYVFPSMVGTLDCRVEPQQVGSCPLLHLYPARLEVPALLVKRLFDLFVASILLVLSAPLMLAIAVSIKLDSRGPVFFRQVRVGLAGRHFTIWKFRSMHVDSDLRKAELERQNAYGDSRLFKMRQDPRITRVGRLLRRSSLDELPQLFNVLLGDMSLVGPRPPLPSEVTLYEPHHFDRLAVVPGITGPWQVGGRNLVTDFEEVVRMERAYIQSWSLLVDGKILLRTIKVVITGEGAF
ncbi:MAG: sugar transferase [Gemmatimonadota bacterium]|nr:sugar transferase [Gemmatimonadota bacterium]